MTAISTARIVDGAARVIANVINGQVFAAGVAQDVMDAQPYVVPMADDFTEVGFPIVTVAAGAWTQLAQPGNERLHLTLNCAVWRDRELLADSVVALYGDRDAIADGWVAHSKDYLVEAHVQSALLTGGPGIVPRAIPAGQGARILLSLPFSVEIVCNRSVVFQPA
ncbi:MAG: hypothetical protein JO246_14085 [Frankiaceae bacterium]|nr:hypothetical protein [Frankiaceae bacterium]MBV9872492.1 hypothetical protein [Frankiaceae bacterium]